MCVTANSAKHNVHFDETIFDSEAIVLKPPLRISSQ